MIDGMSTAKLNVLHWHLTDIESFPVQSERYPLLSGKGAFRPNMVYTRANMSEIVTYAGLRGIRVVPEFDIPGHAGWVFGHPEITIRAPASCQWNPLDPTLDRTYIFLRNFLEEMATIFTDPMLHLGGDEASFINCVNSTGAPWVKAHNLTSASLWPYFWERVFREVLATGTLANKTIQLWEQTGLVNFGGGGAGGWDTNVHPWKALWRKVNTKPGTGFNLYTDLNAILNATALRGVPAILSAPYYLDDTLATHQESADSKGGVAIHRCHGGPSEFNWINSIWKCFYGVAPDDDVPAELATNTSLVMGGEACIWGEGTAGPSIESQVLTSASAVAERLWSGRGSTIGSPSCPGRGMAGGGFISGTECRLGHHVCLMNRLGLGASPVTPGYCDIGSPADFERFRVL